MALSPFQHSFTTKRKSETINNFKCLLIVKKMRIQGRQRKAAHRHETAKRSALKGFLESFQLKTRVPLDPLPVLVKEEVVEKSIAILLREPVTFYTLLQELRDMIYNEHAETNLRMARSSVAGKNPLKAVVSPTERCPSALHIHQRPRPESKHIIAYCLSANSATRGVS
jgi:hypothetical protein